MAAVLPSLAVGWLVSALANRLVFVAWAVVASALSAFALHRAWAHWGSRGGLGSSLVSQGLGFAALGWLVGQHREALDVGGRAVLGTAYPAAAGRPLTWALVGASAAAAGWLLITRRRRT